RALGPAPLLAGMAIVWIADIAAYFVGRAIGRRKLAPAISPGKSWEGVWGGMAGVLVLALLWLWADAAARAAIVARFAELHGQLRRGCAARAAERILEVAHG
ncbi:MAG: phosphatidate cytidylyltransferase, partial [Gammaproteobacteria bacterium]